MGGCCCCASKGPELNNPVPIYHVHPGVPPQVHRPLSSTRGTVSSVSTGLLVDTNLDTSIPVTFRAPPVPVPYETQVGPPQESRGGKNEPVEKSVAEMNSGSTQVGAVKAVEADGVTNSNAELTKAKEVEDEDLKKSTEPFDTSLLEEEDVCPTCLEEYDKENPKIITKCEHHFHLACILEWMERSDTCPVCDKEMVFSTADDS
ncbi:OLC1v1029786C2 [Oldenlandia corymbosa var. corymbosa]|uniref:RING-type E3 ubiquitin transferase n=1 Tax=Oldenlandia corymbosa var. corymbosa TaxID=529605 RepID=A0AAV1CGM0_OLDCO|nr:OLC1v1029786C2 [Oldenlandia corymbosa var. corymbosa]